MIPPKCFLFIVILVSFLVPPIADAQTQRARLFRATGEHQCQSRTDWGHKCSVRGQPYTSCNEAYYALKREDCCRSTRKKMDGQDRLGGVSVNFKITKCTQY